jgi:hypothetical protein
MKYYSQKIWVVLTLLVGAFYFYICKKEREIICNNIWHAFQTTFGIVQAKNISTIYYISKSHANDSTQ